MANETILIVDADTKSQKVLEVSFKKAGYRVVMTDAPTRARELAQDVSPDIIISDTQFPSGGDGFEFLGHVKDGALKNVPFIFLTEERALPQKMKGFELGADDYLTKPIYIKEVTTRVELLLQKRAKEQLTEEDVEEVEGRLADITMIDMLQSIEEELRSGTIHLSHESQSAVIYFREGNILDAICGKLQGEEAIYRLMLWPDGDFVLRYHEQVRRVDRIERDSSALLLEGIRRLDQHSDLLEQLPSLHRMYEANYEALSNVADQIPDEVGRIVRLFDGMRTIREVTEGSPVDDLTTLQIIAKLLEDDFLVDVTPEVAAQGEQGSTSNLANWLAANASKGKQDPGEGFGLREDTSPKFGSSISEMVGKRSAAQAEAPRDTMETAQPLPREPQNTDPFGSRVQPRDRPARRKTLPLKDAFDEIDAWEDDDELRDGRRKTALQWDRPRSGWNIHFDAAEASGAAIREIEEEERRRRDEEAKHISGVYRESTLRFAPAQNRTPAISAENEDLIRRIEQDERRRQQEEAKRIQAHRESMELEAVVRTVPTPRRATDELPTQSRVPATEAEQPVDVADEEESSDDRLRETTPLSSPAIQNKAKGLKALDEGWEALAASSETMLDAEVSEADVFDDSDEVVRIEKARERVTLDLRPSTKLSHLSEESEPEYTAMDAGGLFDLGHEETSPAGDELDEIEIEVIEVMPTVERQARDNELVRAEYDLSIRRTITPAEVKGRPESVADRVTMELRAPATRGPSLGSSESRFFADGSGEHDYDYGHGETGFGLGWVAFLLVAVVGVLGFMLYRSVEEPVSVPPAVVVKTEPPPQTIAPVPAGLGEIEATMSASSYASSLALGTTELTIVLSGADMMPDVGVGAGESDAGTVVAVIDSPAEKPPVEKPPVERPPVERPPVEKPPVEKPPVEKPPTVAVSSSVKKAERLVKQEKWGQALKMLRDLSKTESKNKRIAYLHGLAAFSSNNNGEAITNLSRAERLGYRTGALYLDLGAAYQLDGQKAKAKWAYEKFLKVQPKGRQADEVRSMLTSF